MNWIVMESSSSRVFHMRTETTDEEQVYVIFGRKMYGMEGEIDTGNVDIEVYPVKSIGEGEIKEIFA